METITHESGKSNYYHEVIVFKKPRFQNVFRPNENPAFINSSGLKRVFEKLHFRDGLMWTVGITVKIMLCFQIPPASFGWDFSL